MMTFFLFLLLAQGTGEFPTLGELEQRISSAPELRAVRVELERMRIESNLWSRVTVHANYSQHFSSFVPFVPTPALAVSGGTFVGLSVALPIGELFGRPTVRDLDQQLKALQYERLYQGKLTSLRVLYVERQKRIGLDFPKCLHRPPERFRVVGVFRKQVSGKTLILEKRSGNSA